MGSCLSCRTHDTSASTSDGQSSAADGDDAEDIVLVPVLPELEVPQVAARGGQGGGIGCTCDDQDEEGGVADDGPTTGGEDTSTTFGGRDVRVPSLPYDILDLIFAAVAHADQCHGSWTRSAVSARRALARLARVNRTFHSLAMRCLYRDVLIEWSDEPVACLVRDLDDETRLGVRPRRLYLVGDGHDGLVGQSCRMTESVADLGAHGLLDGVTHVDVTDPCLLFLVGMTSMWRALKAVIQPAALTIRPAGNTNVPINPYLCLAIPMWASLRLVHLVDVPCDAALLCDVAHFDACPHLSLLAWSFLRVRTVQSFWRSRELLLTAAAASDRPLALEVNLYQSPDHLERSGEVFADLKAGLEEFAPEGVSAERRLPQLIEVTAQIGPVHVVLASHARSEIVEYA